MARKSNKTAHVLGLITNEKKETLIEAEPKETAIDTADTVKTSETDKSPANFSKPKASIPILEIASGGSSHLSDAIRQSLIQEVFPDDPEFTLPREGAPSDNAAQPSGDVINPSASTALPTGDAIASVVQPSGDTMTPSDSMVQPSEDVINPSASVTLPTEDAIASVVQPAEDVIMPLPDNMREPSWDNFALFDSEANGENFALPDNMAQPTEDVMNPSASTALPTEDVMNPSAPITEQVALEDSSLEEATNLSIESEQKNASIQKEIQTALEDFFQASEAEPIIEDSNHSEMLDISTPKPKKVSVVTDFQPSDFSIPTSPLENILMHPDFKYAYINIAEKAVTEKVLEYMKRFNMCTCDRCVVDTIALALTHLPAKYIVTSREDSFALMNYYTLKYNISIISELTKACMVVSENPHHDK